MNGYATYEDTELEPVGDVSLLWLGIAADPEQVSLFT